jgi:hypothetical protein
VKRADAQKAIDEAFADGLKHLFAVLVSNLQLKDANAVAQFRRGVAFHDDAHSAASGVVETIFKE